MFHRFKLLAGITLALLVALLTPTVAWAVPSNIWLITTLRADSAVNAEDLYTVSVWPGVMPDWPYTYLHINNQVQGRIRFRFPDPMAGTVSAINFGITQYDPYFPGDTGVGWYVRSTYNQVLCNRGYTDSDNRGCSNRVDSIVGPDEWFGLTVERTALNTVKLFLVNDDGSYLIAEIPFYSDDSTLTYASVGTEFNFDSSPAPTDYPGGFSFYHPSYDSYGGSAGWNDWPSSSGSYINFFDSYSAPCPNPYRGDMPYMGDWLYWYAGTGTGSPSTARCYYSPLTW